MSTPADDHNRALPSDLFHQSQGPDVGLPQGAGVARQGGGAANRPSGRLQVRWLSAYDTADMPRHKSVCSDAARVASARRLCCTLRRFSVLDALQRQEQSVCCRRGCCAQRLKPWASGCTVHCTGGRLQAHPPGDLARLRSTLRRWLVESEGAATGQQASVYVTGAAVAWLLGTCRKHAASAGQQDCHCRCC